MYICKLPINPTDFSRLDTTVPENRWWVELGGTPSWQRMTQTTAADVCKERGWLCGGRHRRRGYITTLQYELRLDVVVRNLSSITATRHIFFLTSSRGLLRRRVRREEKAICQKIPTVHFFELWSTISTTVLLHVWDILPTKKHLSSITLLHNTYTKGRHTFSFHTTSWHSGTNGTKAQHPSKYQQTRVDTSYYSRVRPLAPGEAWEQALCRLESGHR